MTIHRGSPVKKSERDWQSSVTDFLMGFAFAAILMAVMGPCQAEGQCREGLRLRLVDMTHEGAEGFFGTTSDVGCLMLGLERVPELEAQISRLERRGDMREARHADMLEASAQATEIIGSYTEALAASMRRTTEAEDIAGAWWRSPLLWFVAGALVTALVFAGVSLAAP